jgi:competence protein ComEC
MKLLNFTIIKLTFCLVIGILIGYFTSIGLTAFVFISIALLVILGIGLFLSNLQYKQSIWFGIIAYLATITLGGLTIKVHEQSSWKNHYTKHTTIGNENVPLISFRIREVLKSGNYYDKYVIDILKINNTKVSGKSLLNIEKDTLFNKLNVDDILIAKTQFKDLISPLNPHQFNYKSYLKKKHIYHQLFIENTELLKVESNDNTIFGLASQLREKINTKLKRYNFKNDELAIINALLLGQRQDVSKDIYDSYTKAGAIHILAVSGLHVGIILLLLHFVLKPIEYFKHGKVYKTIILVLILWSFAIIAGLSASVVRAVSMFTIVAIAMNLNRPTNVFNTLAISMFFLLLFKPTFIFDVGFQLSYLAVFAIVIIQPMLYSLWHPKIKFFKFLWGIFTVTLAAQFGIIPISLFYFHQFPGLFFVSNLVIIPFLGTILGFGIIVIGLALLNILPEFLASTYGSIIGLMNTFVGWISNQESFLFKNISFNIEHVLISYLLLILIINFIKQKTYRSVIYLLIAILFSQGYFIYDSYKSNSKIFVIFHKSRYSIIGFKNKNQLNLHHNLNDSILKYDKVITNYKVGEHITKIKQDSIQSVYQLKTNKILVIDSIGVYNVKTFTPDIILLRNSPKINLKRLIDSLHPKLIISDGSNYKSYQERWAKTCDVQKIPFHQTSKKGAYTYRF